MNAQSNSSIVNFILRHYLKYDRENPFIFISALLAFLGITAGVMVLMLAMGIMNGTQKEFEKKLFVMNYPLTISTFTQNALNDNLIYKLNAQFPELKFSPFYTTQVIVKNSDVLQGSLLYGIDPVKEAAINQVFKDSNSTLKSTFDIVIGDGLSKDMQSGKNQKLTVYFSEQQAVGFGTMPLQKRFKVDSTFKSGLKAYDKAIAYTTLKSFEALLNKEHGSYDGVHVFTKDPMIMIKKIEPLLSEGVVIEGWWQQNGNFFAAMEMEKKALFLVLLLIILIASLNIISSLLMTVMSRRSEIALLRTLGATSKEIKAIFFKLGIIVGGSGIIAGTIMGLLGRYVLQTFDIITLPEDVYGTSKLPIDFTILDYGMILIGTIIIVFFSSLYPAKKASQTNPIVALKNE